MFWGNFDWGGVDLVFVTKFGFEDKIGVWHPVRFRSQVLFGE